MTTKLWAMPSARATYASHRAVFHRLGLSVGIAIAAFATFAATTYEPIDERWDDMPCPKSMGGGNSRDFPVRITKDGDIIDYHKARWWEIWHRKDGVVTDRIFHFGTCKPYHISWHTYEPQTFVIPAHGSAIIPISVEPMPPEGAGR
jgi:hypothetical protein